MTSGRRLGAVAVVAAVALAFPLVASAKSAASAHLARRGIAHAHARGWIKWGEAKRYRGDVYLAMRAIRRLPKARGWALESQLRQVTAIWDSYISPRATALFSQLRENVDYLSTHRIPSSGTDVTGPDGVVYRYFAGKGLEFHPLANFSRLNALAKKRDEERTRQLADALLARAIPRKGTLLWEYPFPYGRGRPPWASGLAQAVAAQSLARAGALLGDRRLQVAARKAYRAIPGRLDLGTSAGPWVRLYGFDREIVLNAQLQSVLSVQEYGETTGDVPAQTYARRLLGAARGLFSRFDTGDWSRYELGGGYAKRSYQEFVTDLLGKLAKQTGDPFWQDASARFVNYTYEPPVVTQPTPPPTLLAFPQPADGWLDSVQIPIALSKRASLTLVVAGQISTYSKQARGEHVLTWTPGPDVQPGTYPVTVRAVDFGGHHASYSLAPVTVGFDTAPPPLTPDTAKVDTATNVLTWAADEPGTPWLELQLELSDPSGAQPQQILDLGHQATSGSLQLAIPPGTWYAAVDFTNSAGLTTKVYLPALTGAAASP
ncbi:MAG TPA: D-glucuronyl C5-epimerase family protein [Gaiellaceae bacterium]|nr:D-glucuronyl C5-epimerase family protein [Gaiellaceae bacterium]